MKISAFTKTYEKKVVLHFPDFELVKGKITAVIGSNGSGKSTLAKVLAGIEPSDQKNHPLADGSVGYLPQKSYGFHMSVYANLMLNKHDKELASRRMDALKINDLAKKRADRLSGGETARMALARLLMGTYDLLILDEPTAAMDRESTLLAEELIKEDVNGYFFEDADSFVAKLKKFLSLSSEELSKMQKNAIDEAQIYDADTYVENMLQLYEETIEEYDSSYVVESVNLKNDVVHLLLNNGKNEEKIMVSLERYYQEGIRKDDKLTAAQFERLKNEENFVKAYRAALKRISARDYTVKQMRDYLSEKQEVSEEQINEIIEKLTEKGLLDDRRYVIEKNDAFQAMLLSRKQMTARLRKAGIAPEIIEECLDFENSESDKALRRAQKYQNSIHNKSLLIKKQTIRRKLFEDGFSSDDIQQAMSMLDFTEDALAEESVLKSECAKIRRRLERKYSGTDLRNHLYHSLLAKGFANDAVYALINEMEWEDD